MTTSTDPSTRRSGSPVRRVRGLTRANALLMARNKVTLSYAVLLPLLPMGLLLTGDRGDLGVGVPSVTTALLMAFLFPVYYNVLSLVVTRRDELVLKRLRTGEARDGEILAALALPGVLVALVAAVVVVALGLALGLPLPTNPVLLAVLVVLACVLFVAFAFWTAAWTRNAEAAQLTSIPVLVLAITGQFTQAVDGVARTVLERTPGAAVDDLVRISWTGRDGELSLADTWGASGPALLTLLVWGVLALYLARRSMRWEPRA
jgi:ABC-2 type transport system permease protein